MRRRGNGGNAEQSALISSNGVMHEEVVIHSRQRECGDDDEIARSEYLARGFRQNHTTGMTMRGHAEERRGEKRRELEMNQINVIRC